MRFASIGLRAGSRQPRSIDGQPVNGAAGFTLLETLTALAILAIAFVSLFDAQSRGLRAAGAADSYAEARILAQALLADTVSGWNGALIPRKGSHGRFGWSIDVVPERAAWAEIKSETQSNTQSKTHWRLAHVRVTVTWDRDRRIELDTLKLGRSNE